MAGSHTTWCKKHPACRLRLDSIYYKKQFENMWLTTWSPAELKILEQTTANAMLPKEING